MSSTPAHPSTDPAFAWTLRLVGLMLVVLAGFFLFKNIGFGLVDDVLLLGTLGLGVATTVAGWLPEQERPAPLAA